MKISISYPPINSDKGVPLIAQNRQFQYFKSPTYIYPIVPAYAATLLKQAGFDVIWDDGIAEEKTYDKWIRDLERRKPDVIMIETKTPVVKKHWSIIGDLKQVLPSSKIVLVGDHVTALPSESMMQSKVDFVLTGGDYDFLLLNLIGFMEGKTKLLEPGIWYRENNEVKNTGKFVLNHDLDSLPFIDRDLTKWWLYSEKNGNYKRTPGTYTMVGRDCWWRKNGGCTFCSWPTLYPTFRVRKPESLVAELEFLVEKYGVREVFDDTGSFPVGEWLQRFCKLLIEKKLNEKIYFDVNIRFGALGPDEYKLIKKAGFRTLLFGLESASQPVLDKLNKGVKVEEIVRSCKEAKEAGLEPHITIMFGYPFESRDEALETVKLGRQLLKKGYANTVQATIVIPYPGSPLFEEAKMNGWLKTLDWDRYDMRESVMKTTMSDGEIKGMVQEIYKVAFDPGFLMRKILAIRNVDDAKYVFRAFRKVLGHLKDFTTQANKKNEQL